MSSQKSARPVLGEQGRSWLRDGEMSLLPAAARPSRVRWMWAALVVVTVGLVVLSVLIGAQL